MLEIAIDEKCPLANIQLNKLTKTFPDLEANILGVIRDEKFLILNKTDKMKLNDKAYVVINSSQLNRTLSAFGHEEKIAKKILIVGGGNIGLNLAKNLEKTLEDARIKIIEKNKERAELIASELENSIVINGDGLDEEVLKEANIEEIETVLALTNDDENNVMLCVLSEKSSPNKRTIALVNKSNYSLLQSSLKIDDLVDPRMMTVSNILKHVHKGTIETVYSLLDGEYEFIEAEIIESSELINKSLKESNLPKEIRIGAILRKDDIIIPKSNFIFEKKDLVVFLTKRDQLRKVESLFSVSSF
jgi:trk system potassium uptake protein TrkA